jgi:CARDB
VLVATDSTNGVSEGTFGETNNVRRSDTQLELVAGPHPQITVMSVTAPATATANQPLGLSWTVTNSGALPASGPWTDLVFLSYNPQFDPADAWLLGAKTHAANLSPGDSYVETLSNTLFQCVAGSAYIYVQTDPSNQVNLASCSASTASRSLSPVLVQATPYVSLQATLLLAPATTPAGAAFQVSWVVGNIGTGPAKGQWTDTVLLDGTGPGWTPVTLASRANYGPLLPGNSYTQTVTVLAPSCVSGDFAVRVITDSLGEANSAGCAPRNAQPADIQITPSFPDLEFTAVSKPSTAIGGMPFAVSWAVNNAGNATAMGSWQDVVYLSTRPQFDPSAFPVATNIFIGTLAAGSNYTAAADVVLSASSGGTFYAFFVTDATGAVVECSGKSNNIAASQLPLHVSPSQFAVLQVSNVVALASVTGQPMSVSWTVVNTGNQPTLSTVWYDAVYLSKDQVFDPATDQKLGVFCPPAVAGYGGKLSTDRSSVGTCRGCGSILRHCRCGQWWSYSQLR